MDSISEITHQPRDKVTPESIMPERFAHFVLRTSKLAEMREWYCTVLNARVVHENDRLCFITYDEEHHRLALIYQPDLQKPASDALGLVHVAYSYRTLRELLSTYVRLRDQGITPVRPINHGMTLSMYYYDPDGNGVELQVDAFPSKEEAASYFDREAFRENPIGVLFDPEEILRDYEAGVPEVELLRRPEGEAPGPLRRG